MAYRRSRRRCSSPVVCSECNSFRWPSFDVIPKVAKDLSTVIRGTMPHGFFKKVLDYREERVHNRVSGVDRDQMAADIVQEYRRGRSR